MAWVGSGDGFEGGNIGEPAALGLVEHALEAAGLERRREVDDGAHRGGHRDPAAGGHLVGSQAGHAVDAQPWVAGPAPAVGTVTSILAG
jgi:hypothetical protein